MRMKEICKCEKSLVKSWAASIDHLIWGISQHTGRTPRYIEKKQKVVLSNFLDGIYLKLRQDGTMRKR